MHRGGLIRHLLDYRVQDQHEQAVRDRILSYVRSHTDCFKRTHMPCHITASAWILNPDESSVLLIRHPKFNTWIQPGGHADGNHDIRQVALKEASEETGMEAFQLMDERPFDLAIHQVPATDQESAHQHYDICFVMKAPTDQLPPNNPESLEIAWVNFENVVKKSPDICVQRLARKSLNRS